MSVFANMKARPLSIDGCSCPYIDGFFLLSLLFLLLKLRPRNQNQQLNERYLRATKRNKSVKLNASPVPMRTSFKMCTWVSDLSANVWGSNKDHCSEKAEKRVFGKKLMDEQSACNADGECEMGMWFLSLCLFFLSHKCTLPSTIIVLFFLRANPNYWRKQIFFWHCQIVHYPV